MITYAPKTASGFQKLSSSAIEIGKIPLITGPIFGIIFDHITFNSLYFAFAKHPLAFFLLFSYPYLYKKLNK